MTIQNNTPNNTKGNNNMNPAILVALAKAFPAATVSAAVRDLAPGSTVEIDRLVRVRGTLSLGQPSTRVSYSVDWVCLAKHLLAALPAEQQSAVLGAALVEMAERSSDPVAKAETAATKARVEQAADRRGLGEVTDVAPRTSCKVEIEEVAL